MKDFQEPKYFYRVCEFMTTFGKDPGQHEPFTHEEEFKKKSLLISRIEAMAYYQKRLIGLRKTKYFLPFASPQDFKLGKHAAFSISLCFVEYQSEDEQFEYSILGGDVSLGDVEHEISILQKKGYLS